MGSNVVIDVVLPCVQLHYLSVIGVGPENVYSNIADSMLLVGHIGIACAGAIPLLAEVALKGQAWFESIAVAVVLATVFGVVLGGATDYFLKTHLPQSELHRDFMMVGAIAAVLAAVPFLPALPALLSTHFLLGAGGVARLRASMLDTQPVPRGRPDAKLPCGCA